MSVQVCAYDPTVFDVTSMQQAMAIILTPEDDGFDTDRRWAEETAYLAPLIKANLNLAPSSLVLDYGCGVGRLSKALIESTGCSVVGVDISPNMRTFATRYVDSPRFTAMTPELLGTLVREHQLLFDEAFSVWVLQHCVKVEDDIALLRRSLGLGGRLFVLNELGRCVPTNRGWVHDGKDTRSTLDAQFSLQCEGKLPHNVASEALSKRTYWGVYST